MLKYERLTSALLGSNLGAAAFVTTDGNVVFVGGVVGLSALPRRLASLPCQVDSVGVWDGST